MKIKEDEMLINPEWKNAPRDEIIISLREPFKSMEAPSQEEIKRLKEVLDIMTNEYCFLKKHYNFAIAMLIIIFVVSLVNIFWLK